MSNPAVLMLVNLPTKNGGRFKVEDNIGESIHIHYNNFRIDFTIEEFLNFTKIIEGSVVNLIDNEAFNINNFDPIFLHNISHMLVDIERVSMDTIKLSDLIVTKTGLFGVPKWTSLKESKVYRAINGDSKENNKYKQSNLYNQNNQDRVDKVKELVVKKGYPFNDEYIVLFNDQNVIRDGQHRAASMFFSKRDTEIPVIRLHFYNKKYGAKKYLWINLFLPTMKIKAKVIAKKIINRLKPTKY